MSLSVHRRPRDAVAGNGGPIGAHYASTHRHHAPPAAVAAAATTTSSRSSSPEGAEPALPSPPSWQPLPPPLPKRRRVGAKTSADPASASGPASRRTAARMTWPPERTPTRGLGGGGTLPSPKPRGLTREEGYLALGSLRLGPQPRALADADADANTNTHTNTNTNTSTARSPTASSAARVPPRRRCGGIHASTSSPAISSAALPNGRLQASAASPLGSASTPLSALATAPQGARRHPPATKQLTGTRGDPPLRPQAKLSTGTSSALPQLQTTKPTPESPSPQTSPAPPPPFLAAFGHRLVEALLRLNFRAATPQQQTKLTPGTRGGASLPQANTVLFDLNYGHLGYTGVVLMGVYAGLMELLSGWNTILKVFYVLLMILGAFGLGTGLMAATSIRPTGYTHRVSSVCSRLCTCLATFVFIVALACHMGSHGCIAGIVLGVVAVFYMLSIWVEGDPAAFGAFTWVRTVIKDLRQRIKWSGQRGPILP